MSEAFEVLCFVMAHIFIEMVKYLFGIMASLPLNSSESTNIYKQMKILFKSYIIMDTVTVYISVSIFYKNSFDGLETYF